MTVPGHRRVLVMGDEEAEHEVLGARVAASGYQVTMARGIGAACALLRIREFAAVVADLGAADDGALAVVRAAGRGQPHARVLLLLPQVSADPPSVLALLHNLAYVCLRHPVDAAELDELLAMACAGYAHEWQRRPPPVRIKRGARERSSWERAQATLEAALGALAAGWRDASPSPETLAAGAEAIGRRLRVEAGPAFDPADLAAVAQELHDWAVDAPHADATGRGRYAA